MFYVCHILHINNIFNPYSKTWSQPDKMQKIATELAATATSAKKHITDEIGNKYIFQGQILTIR